MHLCLLGLDLLHCITLFQGSVSFASKLEKHCTPLYLIHHVQLAARIAWCWAQFSGPWSNYWESGPNLCSFRECSSQPWKASDSFQSCWPGWPGVIVVLSVQALYYHSFWSVETPEFQWLLPFGWFFSPRDFYDLIWDRKELLMGKPYWEDYYFLRKKKSWKQMPDLLCLCVTYIPFINM